MIRTPLSLSILVLVFFSTLHAQDIQTDKKFQDREERRKAAEARRDSLRSKEEKKIQQEVGEVTTADSAKIIEVTSKLYWYDLENNLSEPRDSSLYEIFRLRDEKLLLYRDLSDVFRSQPLWFYFNLIKIQSGSY